MTALSWTSASPGATRRLAAAMAQRMNNRRVLALYGDLGSGKTCFVKGLAEGLGIRIPVTSPTFTLIREYAGARRLIHVDLYRLDTPEQAAAIGLEDYFDMDAVTAVEWAERAQSIFPAETVHLHFAPGGTSTERVITITNWPDALPCPADS